MKRLLLIVLAGFILLLSACGSDGKKNNSNSSGYPNVAGKYSFLTGDIYAECTDGSSDKLVPTSFNAIVTQSENVLTVYNAEGDIEIPGMTVIDRKDMKGNVEKDASFNLNSVITVTIDGFSGVQTVTYYMNGHFTSTGWYGNYEFSIFFPDYQETCNFTTVFSGDEIE
jgi:hypothetical protein